jgi:hypothetical protein
MWSGVPSKLPEGWALCDGKNGTPTLQDRFIVGYNPGNRAYNKIGNTGGEATHVLTIAECRRTTTARQVNTNIK